MECEALHAQILEFYSYSTLCYTHHRENTCREYLNISDLELWPILPMPAFIRELPPAQKHSTERVGKLGSLFIFVSGEKKRIK